LENIVLRSNQQQQPAREVVRLNMAKAQLRPSRIDTLMIPETVPSTVASKTPVSTLTDDILDILLGKRGKR
jgi:hypothetical protein